MKLTHKGWYGICPIHTVIEGDARAVVPRHRALSILMLPAFSFESLVNLFCWLVFLNPGFQFPVLLTGEIE